MTQVLSSTTNQVDVETLDHVIWFLSHLTVRFETRHLSAKMEEPLILSLIRILHIPEQDIVSHMIIINTVRTLVNLTKCESHIFGRDDPRSDFALE